MGWKRWIAAFDIHGDMADESAVRVFHDFCENYWKPHIRVLGGDLWDFRPLRNGASPEEQADTVTADYQAGINFLKRFKPHIFLRGNHDERLWEWSDRTQGNGMVIGYCLAGSMEVQDELKRMRCEMLPYHNKKGVYKLGSLAIVHGYRAGMHAAKQTCLDYGCPTLMGHIHAVDMWSAPGLDRRVGWSSGCLAQTDMDYACRRPGSMRWNNGFAYGRVNDKTGHFSVYLAEKIEGEWHLCGKEITLK